MVACLALGLWASSSRAGASGAEPPPWAHAPAGLTLERLYRGDPYFGKQAKELRFSPDGRFLAYLWNPQGQPGLDLYVRDLLSGKTQRITSPALTATLDSTDLQAREARMFDRQQERRAQRQAREEAQAAYLRGEPVDLAKPDRQALEALRAELESKRLADEAQRAADAALWSASAASAPPKAAPKRLEDWELRDQLAKARAREAVRPGDLYPGVTDFVWANARHELVLQFRGQLLRWKAGAERPEPLLAMSRPLRAWAYTPDDQGLVFSDETRVLRLRFANTAIETLNPELVMPEQEERAFKIQATTLSEDQSWMAVLAAAPPASPASARQVELMDYTPRFATAVKKDREVGDDKRSLPRLALYVGKTPPPGGQRPAGAKPVFTHPGGDVWFNMSPVAWARDGRHYAFATFEREQDRYRVFLGRADASAAPEVVLERRGHVHNELASVMTPQFTPDGRHLVVTVADEGWRQAALLDLKDHGLRPLVRGAFEAYRVLGFTPDGEFAFVLANKDDPATMNLWRVRVSDGDMAPIGRGQDYHRNAVVDRRGLNLAAVAGQWSDPPELRLYDARGQGKPPQVLTQGRDPAWADIDRIRPERMTFKNRHGDLLQAYVFKPYGWRRTDNRPAVVYVYGGPLVERHMVEPDSFQNTAYLFGMYMAARHGYVMVTLDPRGMSQYGQRFSGANWEQPGLAQTEDLEDVAAAMGRDLGVDPGRIGLTGWSFGGFQTQFAMYTRPELFAAGIAGAGPTQWENYYASYTGRTIGKLERGKPVLRKFSLLPLARQLKRPLLLVHGMRDDNVLFQDTINVYRELQISGKQALVELLIDPEGDHQMNGAIQAVGLHRAYEAFWLRHLGRCP